MHVDSFERGTIPLVFGPDYVQVRAKTYPASEIRGVEVRTRRPNRITAVYLFGALALLCLFGGRPGIFGALLFAAATYGAWRRSQILQYQLFIKTGWTEIEAASSQDGSLIREFSEQVERTMSGMRR